MKDKLSLISDLEIQEKFDFYIELRDGNDSIYKLDNLTDLITTISKGELGPFSLKDCILGYLDCCIYALSNSMDKIMEDAERSRDQRMLDYTPDQLDLIRKLPNAKNPF